MQINNLSQDIKDALSSLVDHEVSDKERNQLSHQISTQEMLRAQTARYHMINDCIKGEPVKAEFLNLSDAVSQALEKEPTVLAPRSRMRWRKSWIQPLAGTALAASVAGLGIAFGPQLLQQYSPVVPTGLQVVAQPISIQPTLVSHKPTRWKTLKAEMEPRLNNYLEEHSEYANQGMVRGVIPYASFVSYDDRKR